MKKIIILLLLLFPITSFSAGIGMSPAKISTGDKPLKAGGEYNLIPNFWIYSNIEEPTTFEISVSCYKNQEGLCPSSEWFIFTPQTFELALSEGQEVQAKIKTPREGTEFGAYNVLVLAKPILETSGETSLSISVGSKLAFNIDGKLSWQERASNWLDKNLFQKAKDSLSNINICWNLIFIVLGLIGFALICQKIYIKMKIKK